LVSGSARWLAARPTILIVVLAGVATLLSRSPSAAQEVKVIHAGSCDYCGIRVQPLGAIRDNSGPHVFRGPPAAAVRLPDGSVLLSTTGIGTPIYHVSADWTLRGELPARFQGITRLAETPEDTVLIWDDAAKTLIVISPTLEIVRRVAVPFGRASAMVSPTPGIVIVHAAVMLPDFVGLPLHAFTTTGRHIGSFGRQGAYRVDRSGAMQRVLARAKDGIAVGYLDSLRVEIWSPSGDLRTVIRRNAAWFRSGLAAPTPDQPPPTFVSAIHVDHEGRLWVAIQVPADDWKTKTTFKTQVFPDGSRHYVPETINTLWQTRLEAWDLASGRVVGSAKIHGSVVAFEGDSDVLGRRAVGDGWAIDVWHVVPSPASNDKEQQHGRYRR